MKFIATQNLSISELQIYPTPFKKNLFLEFHISQLNLKITEGILARIYCPAPFPETYLILEKASSYL